MYGFDPYHILLIVIGASLLLGNWLPRLAFRRPPAASALLMLFGFLGVLLFPLSFEGLDPISSPDLSANEYGMGRELFAGFRELAGRADQGASVFGFA